MSSPGPPPYRVIAASLRDQILDGRLPAGAKLPSEHELAARHRVARATVQSALRTLRHDGLITARKGAGNYVAAAVEGGTVEGTAVEGGAVEGGAVEGTAVEGGAVDGRAVDGRAVEGGAVDGRAVDGRAVEGGAGRCPARFELGATRLRCELEQGHAGPHACPGARGTPWWVLWTLRAGEIDPMRLCPAKRHPGDDPCLLYREHEGRHSHGAGYW